MALLRVMDLSRKDIISLTAKKIDIYYTTTRKTLVGKHQHGAATPATGVASTGLHALQKFCLTIPFFFSAYRHSHDISHADESAISLIFQRVPHYFSYSCFR